MKFPPQITLLIFIGMLLAACKKETLPPSTVQNQPVFSFNGNIGATAVNWQAGVNNYYMYSSYTQSAAGLYSFIGILKNTSNNNNSIEIVINDDVILSKNAASDINKSVVANTYQYTMPGYPKWDSVIFTPKVYHGSPSTFNYAFGDGNSSSTSNLSPVAHVYKHNQNYATSVIANFSNGSPSSLKLADSLFLIKKSTSFLSIDSVSSQITMDSVGVHILTFSADVINGAKPYSYTWKFSNDSTLYYSATETHTFYEAAGLDSVLLIVTDSLKDRAEYDYVFSNSSSSKNNLIDYSVSTPTVVTAPYSLSTVTVNYTDPKGNLYTSNKASQSISSTFQITSVSNYQNNTSNNPTKMLSVTFNCMLYNTAAPYDSIQATDCTAVIAVAYH